MDITRKSGLVGQKRIRIQARGIVIRRELIGQKKVKVTAKKVAVPGEICL